MNALIILVSLSYCERFRNLTRLKFRNENVLTRECREVDVLEQVRVTGRRKCQDLLGLYNSTVPQISMKRHIYGYLEEHRGNCIHKS